MINITRDTLVEFAQLTGKDIIPFLTRVLAFFTGDYNKIVTFYSGKGDLPDPQAFQTFQNLKDERDRIFSTIEQQAYKLRNAKWWILIEQLENIDGRLKTLDNINKWSKSSLKTVGYDQTMQLLYALKSGQTLERVAQDVIRSSNPSDDWYDIAMDNRLKEEDYTPEGEANILIGLDQVNRGIAINSVVAVMDGKSIYGIDIDANFHFDPVQNDIAVLSPDDTVIQDATILSRLKRNQNPASPSDGLQQEIIVGSNRAALNFPIIIRQMTEIFKTDDSFKNFSVLSIEVSGTQLRITYQVQTRLDEQITREVLV